MRFKIISGFFLACTFCFSMTSCLSMIQRDPNSVATAVDIQNILKDRFTQDGYDHASRRVFKNSPITQEQVIKELAGRAIWFKSAPNERHHTYVFPQKTGVAIDWSQVFLAGNHNSRFQTWGVINDPDCCVPGVTCDQKNMKYNGRSVTTADTFGWEYCAGDESLLNTIRQTRAADYQDPACDDVVIQAADSLSNQIRENRCQLKFGTSTGAVGFRKFPNPQFNAKRWEKIGGYKTYSEQMIREGANNSIQPPFRVAMACASCHAGFDPLNTPLDLNNPTWAQIKGETGNQYINISKLMASGMHESTIESQLFTHTRPGTVDTSAVAHDFINNPGAINAIINLPQRPQFKDIVSRWNQVDTCDVTDAKTCQKVAYRDERNQLKGYKFWKWQTSEMNVPHLLKGGEDSVGYDLAVQRVFVNTGMCSEPCWQNNLTNLRELDFTSRGYGETPFNIGQCREQCAAFRANEDRTPEIISYLASRRPTDLKEALKASAVVPASANSALVDAKFKNFVETRFGDGSIDRGQKLFANNCASCHSSQGKNSNFLATTELQSGEQIRADWLGNDKSTSIGEIGTSSCRALHTNHKRGAIWDQFSSETYKNLGPGYYRNISLLNVWAHAPFMHNNAIGPELCGKTDQAQQVVRTTVEGRQLDATGKYICDAYFDPSTTARLSLYEKSMDELLTPAAARRKKITRLDVPIKFPLGIKDLFIEFPAGLPLNTIANFDLKTFVYDFSVAYSLLQDQGDAAYAGYWLAKFPQSPDQATEIGAAVKALMNPLTTAAPLKVISEFYRTCETGDDVENKGHEFGTTLTNEDKKALKAFMATL